MQENPALQAKLTAALSARSEESDELRESLKTFHGEATAKFVEHMNRAVYMLGKQDEMLKKIIAQSVPDEVAPLLNALSGMVVSISAKELGAATRVALKAMAPQNIQGNSEKTDAWISQVTKLGERMLEVQTATEREAAAIFKDLGGLSSDD